MIKAAYGLTTLRTKTGFKETVTKTLDTFTLESSKEAFGKWMECYKREDPILKEISFVLF